MITLPIAYLAPVSYYATLYHADRVQIEACEHYVKQSLRTRCTIATDQGPQTLCMAVEKGNKLKMPIREIRLSDHGDWMRNHLYALATYYGAAPFFEYYIDELRDTLLRGHDGTLFGLDEALRCKICELIGFEPQVEYTRQYQGVSQVLPVYPVVPYYQVARYAKQPGVPPQRAFQPDVSIVDLLFNMGPESVLVLKAMSDHAN